MIPRLYAGCVCAWVVRSQCCKSRVAASANFSLPSSHQVLIVFSKPIVFLAMASNAAAFAGDAVAALKTIMDLAETVPVLGNIVEALQYVKSVADTAEHNKKNCAKVSKRCEALALALESCVREYSEHGGPKRSQVHGLTDLSAGLGRMKTVVDKHSKQGKLGRFLTANKFKEEFDEVDKEIREALELVHFGLSADAVAQNNKLLENATVIMEIDDKMDAAIAHLTDIGAFVRELREQGGGSDAATLDLDVDERLHTLTQMIESSKSVAEHQSLVQDMMQAKIDLMKTKQDLLLRVGKETNATVQATNKAVQHLNRKHNAVRRKSAALKENEIDQGDVTVLAEEPPLGKGSFGEVFKCKYAGQLCAIKYINTASTMEDNLRIYDSFKDEFALMCAINTCPRVVRVFGIITTIPYKLAMIMEYAAEGSLRNYLTKHASTPLEKSMALSLVYDIAYGMKALYAKGVHHRDLKASNVLLDEYFRAKVCDFGLSKASVLQSASASASKGGVVGTFAWLSPEELDIGDDSSDSDTPDQPTQRAALDDEKCDVYSFAMTVWEIISRKLPWDGKAPTYIQKKVLAGKRPKYDQALLEPMYGKKLLALMQNGWAQDPKDRPTFSGIVAGIASFERDDAGMSRRQSEDDMRQDERMRELTEQLQQMEADQKKREAELRQRVEEEVRKKILREMAEKAAQEEAQRKAAEAAQEKARKKADEEAAAAASAGKVDQATIAAAQRKYQGKKAPLCAALEAKDEDAAEALLDGGADPNEVDGRGKNALHWAAQKGCRPPLLQRLVARIHDVNAGNKNGYTALMWAAWHNHLDVVTSLLNHPGIDVNVQDGWNATALHLAALYNHPAIVSQLLSDDNINANLKGSYNNTPLEDAIVWNHHECVKILQDYGAKV